VFNMSPVPSIVRLGHGELFERLYVDEYCGRRSGDAERLAARMVPRLLELQSAARQRGALFLYLITPSKAAHLP